jgi:hypothetical protein
VLALCFFQTASADPLDTWTKVFTISEHPPVRPHFECLVRHVSFTPDGERLLAVYLYHGIWSVVYRLLNDGAYSLSRYWNARTGARMRAIHSNPGTRL